MSGRLHDGACPVSGAIRDHTRTPWRCQVLRQQCTRFSEELLVQKINNGQVLLRFISSWFMLVNTTVIIARHIWSKNGAKKETTMESGETRLSRFWVCSKLGESNSFDNEPPCRPSDASLSSQRAKLKLAPWARQGSRSSWSLDTSCGWGGSCLAGRYQYSYDTKMIPLDTTQYIFKAKLAPCARQGSRRSWSLDNHNSEANLWLIGGFHCIVEQKPSSERQTALLMSEILTVYWNTKVLPWCPNRRFMFLKSSCSQYDDNDDSYKELVLRLSRSWADEFRSTLLLTCPCDLVIAFLCQHHSKGFCFAV